MTAIQMECPHLVELLQLYAETEALVSERSADTDNVLSKKSGMKSLDDLLTEYLMVYRDGEISEGQDELTALIHLIVAEALDAVLDIKKININYEVNNAIIVETSTPV